MTAPVVLQWDGREKLRVMGEVDMSNADLLIDEAAKRTGEPLVLDLTAVTFIESYGLKTIIDIGSRTDLLIRIEVGSLPDRLIDMSGLRGHLNVLRVSSDDLGQEQATG